LDVVVIKDNMCKDRNSKRVLVKIPEDLSCTGYARFKYESIDGCIAPMIEALQKGAIDMRGSCCGHGKFFGDINLQDGRTLVIIPSEIYFDTGFKEDLIGLYKKYKEKIKD